MRNFPVIFAVGVLLCATVGTLSADTFSIEDENDFWGMWSDKYYTNHTRFAYTYDSEDVQGRAYFFSFGQEMYAPRHGSAHPAPKNDHPYAGFLYASAGCATWEDDTLLSAEVQLGVVGPASMAHGVQRDFHHMIGEDRLEGWDSQVKNQLGANLICEMRERFVLIGEMESGWAGDMICRGVMELGTVRTLLSAGSQLRFGYDLPKNFGFVPMRQSTSVAIEAKTPKSVYAFWDFQGDAIIYDVTLGGELLRDFDTDIDPYPFAFQSSIGIEAIFGGWTLTIYQSFRTHDFHQADHTFSAWGGFKISYSF